MSFSFVEDLSKDGFGETQEDCPLWTISLQRVVMGPVVAEAERPSHLPAKDVEIVHPAPACLRAGYRRSRLKLNVGGAWMQRSPRQQSAEL
jgi:hypothetical protein